MAANKGITPYEKLYRKKPEVLHLHRFGCTAYRLLPKQHGKFSARAETIYMLGYVHDSTTIWCLWDADRKCVIQASNVRLKELADSSEPATKISDPFGIANTDAVASRQDDASQ